MIEYESPFHVTHSEEVANKMVGGVDNKIKEELYRKLMNIFDGLLVTKPTIEEYQETLSTLENLTKYL